MSISDDISSQMINKVGETVPQLMKTGTKMVKDISVGTKEVISGVPAGIVLVFKGAKFTGESIMNAIGRISNNPKYYTQNISIAELEKNSDIKQIDAKLTKKEMQFLNESCKKYGIKYNAVVDKSNSKEPTYYVFFKGKETSVIEQAMKESYQLFLKEQVKPKLSVKAKLAFFRNRVAARDQAGQELGKEKHQNRSERQR